METWVQLPTWWVRDLTEDSFLKKMNWSSPGKNSHNTAALMVLLAIASNVSHRETGRNPVIGSVELSFSDLSEITSLSRKLVSEGLKKLVDAGLIEKNKDRRVNRYKLQINESNLGWGKLPAKKLYDSRNESIKAFKHFKLRSKIEMNALKIYFLVVALRDSNLNHSMMTYDTITKYTGVRRSDINGAISFLTSCELVRVIRVESDNNEYSIVNSYRLIGIEAYRHAGTIGKADTDEKFIGINSDRKN